jgi:lipopolysaccharide export system permease protein
MKIIARYILRDIALTFILTLTVFTFVTTTMVLFKVSEFIAAGGDGGVVLKIFLSGLPVALGYSLPISILSTVLLVFGRLSANGEITALKACGISMKRILVYPALLGLLLSGFALYLNAVIIPHTYHQRRVAITELGFSTPLALIEEGRFIRDFPGMMFYFGSKKGDRVSDVIIYQYGPNLTLRNIRAKHGTLRLSDDGLYLLVDLADVRIDPFYDDRPGPGNARHLPLKLTLPRSSKPSSQMKKANDMTLTELHQAVDQLPVLMPQLEPKKLAESQMQLTVEFHRRIAMALSCFIFVLLGVPLGTQTHRRESTVGIAISLLLVLVFYLFIIVAKTLTKHPDMHPYLICWAPIVLAVILSAFLIRRCE